MKATSAMPAAGPARAPTSLHVSPSSAGAGRPCGSAPTTGSASASPNTAVTIIERTTTTSTPGTGDFSHLSTKMMTSDPRPKATASGSASPAAMLCTIATTSGQMPSASIEKPSSFGICDTITSSAIALR